MLLDAIRGRLRSVGEIATLELRLLLVLADLWHHSKANRTEHTMKVERILISANEVLRVTGTIDEIERASVRMARRTGSCVTIAVVVGHYHRRNCEEHPRGGFLMEGN